MYILILILLKDVYDSDTARISERDIHPRQRLYGASTERSSRRSQCSLFGFVAANQGFMRKRSSLDFFQGLST